MNYGTSNIDMELNYEGVNEGIKLNIERVNERVNEGVKEELTLLYHQILGGFVTLW